MPMHNLLCFSKNFRKTTGSFWNYYPDIPNSGNDIGDEKTSAFYSIKDSESFDYKTRLVGKLPDREND